MKNLTPHFPLNSLRLAKILFKASLKDFDCVKQSNKAQCCAKFDQSRSNEATQSLPA